MADGATQDAAYIEAFKCSADNKEQALHDKDMLDYEALLVRLDEVLNLKETVRAQTAEIERLNNENADLASRLAHTATERDNAVFSSQKSDARIAELTHRVSKLLDVIRAFEAGTGSASDLLVCEFNLPHNAIKKPSVGLLGRTEIIKERGATGTGTGACGTTCFNCDACGGSSAGLGGASCYSSGAAQTADIAGRQNPQNAMIKILEGRVESLVAERDGIMSLYTSRISEMQASFARVRDTLATRAERAEGQLHAASTEMVRACRRASDLEQRALRLEGDLVSLAARGSSAAAEARDAANDILRNARRELKLIELTREKQIKDAKDATRKESQEAIRDLRENLAHLTREKQDVLARLAQALDRLDKCELKLRVVTEENALVRRTLRLTQDENRSLVLQSRASSGLALSGQRSEPLVVSQCEGVPFDWRQYVSK